MVFVEYFCGAEDAGTVLAKKGLCHTSFFPLATIWSSHQVQDIDACSQTYHGLSTLLLLLALTSLQPLEKPVIGKRAMAHGTTTERQKIINQNMFVHCSTLMEWSHYPYPEWRISDNIQKTAENSSLPWAVTMDESVCKMNKCKSKGTSRVTNVTMVP